MSPVARGIVLFAVVLLFGCGSARRSEPIVGRFVPATPQIARGEGAFDEHCHMCHSGGEASLGPALNNKPLPAFLLKLQVRHGLGAMPAFNEREISEEELDALVAYVQALREHGSSALATR